MDDLDLDASLDDCVTVVEWGEGLVEGLATDRLDISIEMSPAGAGDHDWRTVAMTGIGQRWESVAESGVLWPTRNSQGHIVFVSSPHC